MTNINIADTIRPNVRFVKGYIIMNLPSSKAEQTKNLIAQKAKEIFSQKGYFLASMEDICVHAGASKGSVYYHFKNKADLFIYIWEQYVQEWMLKWEEKSAHLDSGKEKLYALAELYASDYESPLLAAATEFAGSESANPQIKAKLDELNAKYIPVVEDIIEQGIKNKEFKDIGKEDMTIITFGFLAGIGAACQMSAAAEDINRLHKLSVDIFLSGLSK